MSSRLLLRMQRVRLALTISWFENQVPKPLSYAAQTLELGKCRAYPDGVLHHYYFMVSVITSHPRSTLRILNEFALQVPRVLVSCRTYLLLG